MTHEANGFPPGPVVKICGLTRPEDVMVACELGAWALGFVLAPSPRRLAPADVRRLVEGLTQTQGPRPLTVGVFGDASAGEIAEAAIEAGVDAVQLHGKTGPDPGEARAALAERGAEVLILRAVPVPAAASDARSVAGLVARAREGADVVVLDTGAKDRFGGTGTVFPWALGREVGQGFALLVAGGIGPNNMLSALAESGAWGVDVSSGVETSPGIKDARLMRELFHRLRAIMDSGPASAMPNLDGVVSPQEGRVT